MKSIFLLMLAASALAMGRGANAGGLTFDYKDPKEISAVALTLDSKLEPIVGYAKGISGKVIFDPANPKATTGKIAVDAASVQFANEGYTATARGYALNSDKYPQIFFALKKVVSVTKVGASVFKATVQADFICHGITTPMTVPVTASYFPGLAEQRTNGSYKGDVLVLRTNFAVSRTRQGISAGIPIDMVGDKIDVRVAVVGIHYAPGQKRPGEPKQADAPPAAKNETASRWQLEVEERDNPLYVAADFNLTAKPPTIALRSSKGDFAPTNVRYEGNRLTFHFPNNPQIGEADAVATLDKDTIRGEIHAKDGVLRFHGRRLTGTETVKKSGNALVQGPGFGDLKIVADGKEWSLPERMRFYHVPGLALARIENYSVVETGYFGVTDIESGDPVDETTLFQASSMGGSLVNIAALRLAAQDKLDLDRPANDYLKAWKIPDNTFTKTRPITVLDLMNGTSGFTQYKFTGYRPDAPHPTLTELLQGADKAEMEPVVAAEPSGAKRATRGINKAVLEQLLTEATGQKFDALMQETVLTPFGMTHSTYEPDPAANAGRKITVGHYASGERMLDRIHVYPEQSESGLWTTPADFASAVCQILRLQSGRANALLAPGSDKLLALVSTDHDILNLPIGDNGFFYSGGDPYGYYAEFVASGKKGCGLVVMQNRMGSWSLYGEIVGAVSKRNRWNEAGQQAAK